METIIIRVTSKEDKEQLLKAASTLKKGGLVAFPTETVYGIGANALNLDSIKQIYKAKGRPSDNPLIVHVADSSEVTKYVKYIPKVAKILMEAFWPGPLTLVFEKNDIISNKITGGLKTIAIRIPENTIAREIIKLSGLPIAAPSANISGRPSPTSAKHVIEDLNGQVDMIVDGGESSIGIESTVLDLTTDIPMILRPGGTTKAMIESVIGAVILDKHLMNTSENEVPRSPGMKYKHYAPKGRLGIYDGNTIKVVKVINASIQRSIGCGDKPGVIATIEDKELYECDTVIVIGSKHKPKELAANLFKVLREMDELGVERIYIRAFKEEGIGVATMNRLLKAAGNERHKV